VNRYAADAAEKKINMQRPGKNPASAVSGLRERNVNDLLMPVVTGWAPYL
jgi:hypothetical protein